VRRKRYCSICGQLAIETLQRRRSGVGVFTLYACEEHRGIVLYDYMDAYIDGDWKPRNQLHYAQSNEARLL
jgi:hypothetical protein